jgi:hypothetical protein
LARRSVMRLKEDAAYYDLIGTSGIPFLCSA